MRVKRLGVLFSALIPAVLLLSGPSGALGNTPYTLQQFMTINGAPAPTNLSTDILWYDRDTNEVYVADRRPTNGIDVFSAENDYYLGTFDMGNMAGTHSDRNLNGPNGVLTDDQHRIWAGDGVGSVHNPTQSEVVVGTLNGSVTAIPTGGNHRTDEMGFDPLDHIVLAANDAESPGFDFLSFISSNSLKVVKKLLLDGTSGTPLAVGAEQPVWDRQTRMFYMTLDVATSGEIDTIDPKTMSITHRLTLTTLDAGCTSVNGLALDPDTQTLAVGCPDAGLIVRVRDWSLLASIPQAAPSDEEWFNPGNDTFLFGLVGGTPQGVAIVDANTNTLLQVLTLTPNPSSARCCNVTADQRSNKIFQPLSGYGIAVEFPSGAPDLDR